MTEHETDHLSLDWIDRVWLETKRWIGPCLPPRPSDSSEPDSCDTDSPTVDGPVFVGYVNADPQWPVDRLGPEPNWFLTEMGELRDYWEDSQTGDYRGEVLDTYRRQQGF